MDYTPQHVGFFFSTEGVFKTMDYVIPTVSRDSAGLLSRPCQAERALRWLKEALHRQGGPDPSEFRDLSWHSFRVFIPDCAFSVGNASRSAAAPPDAR